MKPPHLSSKKRSAILFLCVFGCVCLSIAAIKATMRSPYICDWCQEIFYNNLDEKTNVWDMTLCPPHWTKLDKEADKMFGIEFSIERMEWIYEQIKQRM